MAAEMGLTKVKSSGLTFVRVHLRSWSSDVEGVPLLTNQCASMDEVREELGRLRKRLDTMEKEAKTFFKKNAPPGG